MKSFIFNHKFALRYVRRQIDIKTNKQQQQKTSLLWPSQNFLLYIRNIFKMKVTKWINNFKKICQSPPLPWGYIQPVQIITI